MKRPLLLWGLAMLLATAGPARAAESFVYIGTYTNFELILPPRNGPPGERSKGIYVCRFDPDKGTLSAPELAAESVNPTYMAFHPSKPVLYAANEVHVADATPASGVSAFKIDPATGKLTAIGRVAPGGTAACYVKVDAGGRNVLVANFQSGSVAVLPIAEDGGLKPASAFVQDEGKGPTQRQLGPHAHSFNPTPDGKLAVAADFGADKLFVFDFEAAAGTLKPHDPPSVAIAPGSAPRHLTFGADGKTCYVLNEITSAITVLAYDAEKGTFRELQSISTLPPDFKGNNTAAEIQVHPSGKFLFASNRGHNSIAVLAIGADGTLSDLKTFPAEGRTPRNFSLDPTGKWLLVANQSTNNVVVFAVDQESGALAPNGQKVSVPAALCVRFWQPE
jgi:6-phosphogluconolactonase